MLLHFHPSYLSLLANSWFCRISLVFQFHCTLVLVHEPNCCISIEDGQKSCDTMFNMLFLVCSHFCTACI